MPTDTPVAFQPAVNVRGGPYLWEVQQFQSGGGVGADIALGVQSEAPRITLEPTLEPVLGQNLGEGTIQDTFHAGVNATVSGVMLEFNSDAFRQIYPWYQGGNNMAENLGRAGLDLVGGFARATIVNGVPLATFQMTATALHPSFSTMKPYRFIFGAVTLAPNNPMEFFTGTRIRNLPFRFQLLPYTSALVNQTVYYDTVENQ